MVQAFTRRGLVFLFCWERGKDCVFFSRPTKTIGERTLSLKSIGGPNNTNVSLIITLVSLRTYNQNPPNDHTQ